MTQSKTQHAKADKPFRPEGVSAQTYPLLSTLQRCPSVKKLQAKLGRIINEQIVTFYISKEQFKLFSIDPISNLLYIWNDTKQDWELREAKVEDFFPWLNSKLGAKK